MGTGFFQGSTLQVINPISRTPKCGACGLYKTCKSPKMEFSGEGKRRVLIVAEAPGEEEDKKGTQLIGKSGKYLEDTLARIGVNMRKDCWLTNALICRPPGNEIKSDNWIDYCRPNLIRTIEELKPDVTILLGGTAAKSLIPYVWSRDVDQINRWVGWRAPSTKINSWVCPTYHPSFLLRMENQTLEGFFKRHLKQAFKLKDKPWDVVPNYEADVELVLDPKVAADFLDEIESGIVAFDYETNMLKPDSDKARVVSCSVCWANGEDDVRTIAFPLFGRATPALTRLLKDRRVSKVASNMKFEDRWTRRALGVRVRGWIWDTMINSHLLDNRSGITSIKFLSFIYCGVPLYDEHLSPYLKSKDPGGNEPNRIDEIGLSDLLKYNGLDSLLEYLVAEKQAQEMGFGSLFDLAR